MQLELHRDSLRVPVQRAHVEIHTERGERKAVIFLAPEAAPEDVFEDESAFLPIDEDGKVRLFARSAIVSVVVDGDDSAPESLAMLGVAYQVRAVAVHLRNGKVITGSLRSLLGTPRTLDVLNQPAKSFAIHADGKVFHVAKAHVEHIEEMR